MILLISTEAQGLDQAHSGAMYVLDPELLLRCNYNSIIQHQANTSRLVPPTLQSMPKLSMSPFLCMGGKGQKHGIQISVEVLGLDQAHRGALYLLEPDLSLRCHFNSIPQHQANTSKLVPPSLQSRPKSSLPLSVPEIHCTSTILIRSRATVTEVWCNKSNGALRRYYNRQHGK